ncbi:hypothetical protein DSM104443_01023 [Usitatibacter rugosus]|uniref:2OG-Fe(II) oxygenase n=1 Tax=Usitatibacter rugosus TaxID=2732067 RepID=A0A6M4GS91_9PROT|nr:hypothetical protein [Usitatibacter rugosus]QJR09972.1 hypothetical protein DSM104443_01023 [Usitatibacter rugosus]
MSDVENAGYAGWPGPAGPLDEAGRDVVARTIEHVCAAIDAAPHDVDPYFHLRLADVFPADVYAQMLDCMPEPDYYRRMSGRARAKLKADERTKLDLFPEWIRILPPGKRSVWEGVGVALNSAAVRDAFMRRLAPGLERRFGPDHASVGMYSIPVLTRDVPGYSIGIHPDTRWKAMTVQLYLPRDSSIEHVGTVFHKKDAEGRFTVATRMPFVPNSGYAFAVGQDTFHSVDTVGPEVNTRDSILLTYFVDRSLLERAQNRAKRFGNFLFATARSLARP